MEDSFRAAVKNIATHGDTDVFPFPIDNHIFYDDEEKTVKLLMKIHHEFDNFLFEHPPVNEYTLAVLGYTGYRWVTQLDPIWNAYLLGLVISIGDNIEKQRIPVDMETVFSYRFKYDDKKYTVFDTNIGWPEFQQVSVKRAQEFENVLICDIADFYPRIYHHRLENALRAITRNTKTIDRIMQLLKKISGGVSYGLPIGGPAARLLSELLLDSVDRLLVTNGITFCRFSDDYHIFAPSEEQSYVNLQFICEKLLENEGLSLQKAKTRIMSSEEFLSLSEIVAPEKPQEPDEAATREFLSFSLRYDLYSDTADEDYEVLKKEVKKKFDIVGMLGRELRKTRIHQALTKKLISAVSLYDPPVLADITHSLIDNSSTLYPVFPSVMSCIKSVLPDLDEDTRLYIFGKISEMINNGSHIVNVPINLCYAVRVLSEDPSVKTERVLDRIYKETTGIMVKRDIILIMAKRNARFWIPGITKKFNTLTTWERRSLIIASFIMGDAGKFWRNSINKQISPIDQLSLDWVKRKAKRTDWSIPV